MGILLSSNLMRLLVASLRLVTVFIGFAIIGWLLNGFAAPQMAWTGTLAMGCYLIWVGSGGIALASVWVVGLMSVAAIHQLWFHDLPRPAFRYIAMVLLANWLFALGVVWLLGKVSDYLRQRHLSRIWVFSGLICFVAAGLAFGWQFYPEILLLFLSF